MMRRTGVTIVLVVIALAAVAVGAADASERPSVGVALGGGAAKGFAHIGVLQVLEEVGMPVDCITGVSMGSIVAGMYAVGYTASELESIVVEVDWTELFSDREGRRTLPMEQKLGESRCIASFPVDGVKVRLQPGLLEGRNVTRFFSRLSLAYQKTESFRGLPIPFACVATDIMTGEAVVLKRGFLAEAMRASMAIPTIFAPVKIDGRLLVDGGLARLLPAEDVRDLGADIIIGVDVGKREYTEKDLRSFITISNQVLNLMLDPALEKQHRLCDILIIPDMEGVSLSDFRDARRIIGRGRDAALAILPRLQALADSLNDLAPGSGARTTIPMESIHLESVAILGPSSVPRRVIEKQIGVKPPVAVSIRELDEGVGRIRGSQLFERVNSRIDADAAGGGRLVLELHEKTTNELGVGLRYDTRREMSLLASAAFRGPGPGGGELGVDAVLREEYALGVKYTVPLGLMRAFGVRTRVDASSVFLDVYDGNRSIATCRTGYYFGELALGTLFSTRTAVVAGARAEYLNYGRQAASAGLPRREDVLFPYFGLITLDTFDRTVYPRRGIFAQLGAEGADENMGSDASFFRAWLDWRAVVPVSRKVSVLQNLYLGTASGDEVPLAYLFFLGGVDERVTLQGKETSFYGLKHEDKTGRHIQMFHLGFQWDALKERYLILVWNVGNVFDEWNGDISGSDYVNGGGLTLGIDTILGPVEVSVMTSELHDFLAYFSAGYKF
jgi:NTE family protein